MSVTYGLLEGPRFELDCADDLYPASLREVRGYPDRLYGIGDPYALASQSVSVVGARKATPYGIACAELAAQCAADMGIGVVSGAAIGCDQASQREALRRRVPVCAVLGSGANVVYPASSRGVLEEMVALGGAVISIQPWGAPPNRWAFVKRNAVIAALSEALVICEAGMPSGTFGTAQYASDMGREILVFPGSVFSPNSTGSNYLIANNPDVIPLWDQACLEIAYSRIYGRLRCSGASGTQVGKGAELDEREACVMEALRASPSAPGELADALAEDLTLLMRMLGKLEIEGRVVRLVDGRYCPSEVELRAQRTYDAS